MLPVIIKFCFSIEELHAAIILGLILKITDYDILSDEKRRTYFDSKYEDSRKCITMFELDKYIDKYLKMDVNVRLSRYSMELLQIYYRAVFVRKGLTWITKKNERLSVSHMVYAILPAHLPKRLQSEMQVTETHLKNDFKAFLPLHQGFKSVRTGLKWSRIRTLTKTERVT